MILIKSHTEYGNTLVLNEEKNKYEVILLKEGILKKQHKTTSLSDALVIFEVIQKEIHEAQ